MADTMTHAAEPPTHPGAPTDRPIAIQVTQPNPLERRKLRAGSKMILEDLGGRIATPILVTPLEISATGLWFRFDKFVYNGTACSLVLKTPSRSFMRMRGKVVSCDCPEAGRFCIGVKFHERIDLDEVIGAGH